ncbi:solute carrier family 41 member 3-like [Agrilus planipennis]|uniref:Solute carrier family 41 member 3-like n=1 Tax=Agrilus planipennis TaxID=224129 RepID=A0A1W4W7K0_AGRPL|nr:solute carrier family 41 member 3-like [Agrilus planipennis]XP_018320069.1 solute carrier family 41 member 3-like [Agrilus planipennis]
MVGFIEKKEVETDRTSTVSANNVSHDPMPEIDCVRVQPAVIKKNSLAISISSEYSRLSKGPIAVIRQESIYQTIWQISLPFFIASLGSIGAGVVLQAVEDEEVFKINDALYVCVPAVMGLKGNLDMCLASRLSTQANLGHMENKRNVVLMAIGNMAIVQVQAIAAAIFVTGYALLLTLWIYNVPLTVNAMLLVASSVCLTATLSCFILDFLIVMVVYFSFKYKINPDNICSPIIASIGDVVSMGLLALFAKFFYEMLQENRYWIPIAVISVWVVVLFPCWLIIVRKNRFTKDVLLQGWIPVFSAVIISGAGGLILNHAVAVHPGFSSFQPVVNGKGGDIVSIHTSRIATLLHQTAIKGQLPPMTALWVTPWAALCHGTFSAKTARLLIPISLVGHTVFVIIVDLIQNLGQFRITVVFFFAYIVAVFIQIFLLLYIAHYLTHLLWRFKLDPDTSAIPYLTALGDLFGTSLLFAAFSFCMSVGYPYTPISSDGGNTTDTFL